MSTKDDTETRGDGGGKAASTIRDVARQAGVSVTTVSATLNGTAPVSEALQKRVWSAVEAMNYRPNPIARHLRSARSTTIGLVVPDIAAPFWAHVAKAVHQSMSRRGYRIFLSSNDDNPDRELDDIRAFAAHQVAGLLIAPTSLGEDYPARLAGAIECPTVLIDRTVPGLPCDVVTDDNAYGAKLLTDYLLRLGHRRIGFIAGRTGISTSDERLSGFLATMEAASVPVRPEYLRREAHLSEHAFLAVQQMMSLAEPPTALITINYAQSHGVVSGVQNLGLSIPNDISLVSFDGFHDLHDWRPGITSLTQDIDQTSTLAAELLLQRIASSAPTPPQHLYVPPKLRVRDSASSPTNR